jgi:hypothetical protein
MKSAIMATVTAVWAVYMLIGIAKNLIADSPLPNPSLWGVPGMVWLALNPPIPSRKSEPDK